MPIFGKSLFETVLDGLGPEEPEADVEVRMPARPSGSLAASMVTAFADHGDEQVGSFAGLYGDFDEMPVAGPPEWVGRITLSEVAEDLALSSAMTEEALRERRRSFARLNHPDRVGEIFRTDATIRMKIANRLVDDALIARRG